MNLGKTLRRVFHRNSVPVNDQSPRQKTKPLLNLEIRVGIDENARPLSSDEQRQMTEYWEHQKAICKKQMCPFCGSEASQSQSFFRAVNNDSSWTPGYLPDFSIFKCYGCKLDRVEVFFDRTPHFLALAAAVKAAGRRRKEREALLDLAEDYLDARCERTHKIGEWVAIMDTAISEFGDKTSPAVIEWTHKQRAVFVNWMDSPHS
jgi:hypothetical protein